MRYVLTVKLWTSLFLLGLITALVLLAYQHTANERLLEEQRLSEAGGTGGGNGGAAAYNPVVRIDLPE